MTPSNESKKLAEVLVEVAFKDKVFDNREVMTVRIAQAIEESWQQGFDDCETTQRIASLRENK